MWRRPAQLVIVILLVFIYYYRRRYNDEFVMMYVCMCVYVGCVGMGVYPDQNDLKLGTIVVLDTDKRAARRSG